MAVADARRAARLQIPGIEGLSAARATAALGRLLADDATHAVVMSVQVEKLLERYPAARSFPILEHLVASVGDAATEDDELRQRIVGCATRREREALLLNYLREKLAGVLGLEADAVDTA